MPGNWPSALSCIELKLEHRLGTRNTKGLLLDPAGLQIPWVWVIDDLAQSQNVILDGVPTYRARRLAMGVRSRGVGPLARTRTRLCYKS